MIVMNEEAYHAKVEQLFLNVEHLLESVESDVETDQQEGLLLITLPEGSQLVFSRQPVLQELWLASPTGAFHFRHSDKGWVTLQGQTLSAILQSIFHHFKISIHFPSFLG